MKSKLMTICFAAMVSMFSEAMDLDALMEYQQDLVADRAAIASVGSLADFASLPDLGVKRLNSNFVAEARAAYVERKKLATIQTLSDFSALDTNWLQPELVKAIKRADIKENFNLPASLYENIGGIPKNNTIGTQLIYEWREPSTGSK